MIRVLLRGDSEQTLHQAAEYLRRLIGRQNSRKSFRQAAGMQGFAAIGMALAAF